MKNKITILILLSVLTASVSFAFKGKDEVNHQAFASFHQKFTHARDVSWSVTDSYTKATFRLQDQVMFAYFTEAGELVGVLRNILSTQLPIQLQTQLKKNVKDGWITELIEFSNDNETIYYVQFENAVQKVTLESNGNSWSVNHKTKKPE